MNSQITNNIKNRPTIAAVASAAYLIVTACLIVASPSISEASPACPDICGTSCQLDANGIPIYCSTNGQCFCPPGYDLEVGPPMLCRPHQPELQPSGSERSGSLLANCDQLTSCTATPWGSAQGPWKDFDLVAVHGTSPGGEPFMPVWGFQATFCGVLGTPVTDVNGMPVLDTDGHPIRSWASCVPNPFLFCQGVQNANQDQWNPPNCFTNVGANTPPADFTSASPYLDGNPTCTLLQICHGGEGAGFDNPARIDFANNVIVYRAPIVWENHAAALTGDDDYTMNLHSPGGELYDTTNGPRLHIEFQAAETINHFGDPNNSFGATNQFWIDLHKEVDNNVNHDDVIIAWLKNFVGGDHDPMAVVVGVPSIDCCDHPHLNTTEIHPVLALAIRIQEYPQPEKWAFFYRKSGNNGGCGKTDYFPCKSIFKLWLSRPFVPAGKVLQSADVQVDAQPWARDGSTPTDTTVASQFDLVNGTILNITLPGDNGEGVVGLVTVTPVFDTTPPTITCPSNQTVSATSSLGGVANYPAPTVSDNCGATASCTPPSGSTFPIGTNTVTCTATDGSGNTATCTFTVTVLPADLLISKAVVSGQAKPGQLLTYTIIVTNTGPGTASGVVVSDPVPQGTTFSAVSTTQGTFTAPPVGAGGTVTVNLGTLANGASAKITLTVKVSLRGNNLIVNTATVTSATFDPNLANNSATVTSTRRTTVKQ